MNCKNSCYAWTLRIMTQKLHKWTKTMLTIYSIRCLSSLMRKSCWFEISKSKKISSTKSWTRYTVFFETTKYKIFIFVYRSWLWSNSTIIKTMNASILKIAKWFQLFQSRTFSKSITFFVIEFNFFWNSFLSSRFTKIKNSRCSKSWFIFNSKTFTRRTFMWFCSKFEKFAISSSKNLFFVMFFRNVFS